MGLFDNVGKSILDVSQGAIQKGKEMADIAKYNSMISDEEKRIIGLYEQIGREYAKVFGDAPAEFLVQYFNGMKEAKDKIEEYQKKLEEIKRTTKCTSCGAEVSKNSQFCLSCGTKMIIEAEATIDLEKKFCSSCGTSNNMDSKFCMACGTFIEENNNNQGE